MIWVSGIVLCMCGRGDEVEISGDMYFFGLLCVKSASY